MIDFKREFKVECNVGAPQVSYKETIRKPVKAEAKYAKQSGGKGQYGHAVIEMEPTDGEYTFENAIVGGAIPKEYIPAIDGVSKKHTFRYNRWIQCY